MQCTNTGTIMKTSRTNTWTETIHLKHHRTMWNKGERYWWISDWKRSCTLLNRYMHEVRFLKKWFCIEKPQISTEVTMRLYSVCFYNSFIMTSLVIFLIWSKNTNSDEAVSYRIYIKISRKPKMYFKFEYPQNYI